MQLKILVHCLGLVVGSLSCYEVTEDSGPLADCPWGNDNPRCNGMGYSNRWAERPKSIDIIVTPSPDASVGD